MQATPGLRSVTTVFNVSLTYGPPVICIYAMALAYIDGTPFWYNVSGESGTPVILIMGFATRGNAWDTQIKGLEGDHQVMWYDHRGIGESGQPNPVFGMKDMARDVVGLMDAKQWRAAHVVGISMGGMVAQELALEYGHRVRSLSLIATTAGGHRGNVAVIPGVPKLAKCFLGTPKSRIRAFKRTLFPDSFIATKDNDWFRSLLRRDFNGHPSLVDLVAQGNACRAHDTAKRLHRLRGLPTLVVCPEQDVVIHASESRRLARLIPGAHLMKFADAGHGVNWQYADILNEALLSHFEAADARFAA